MLTIFNRTQLAVTQDIQSLNRWIDALKKSDITYKVITQSMGHNTRRNGSIGGIGENAQFSILYYLYVPRSKLSQAKQVCRLY